MKTLILAALAALLAASAAQAGERVRFQKTIQIADLDLQTQAGADTMISRLEAAAASACRGQPLYDEHQGAIRERACRSKAVAAAAARLDAPLVTARLRTKDSPALLAKR